MSPASWVTSSTGSPGSPSAERYCCVFSGSSSAGSYTSQRFSPDTWSVKTSCVSWWTGSPWEPRGVKYAFAWAGWPK